MTSRKEPVSSPLILCHFTNTMVFRQVFSQICSPKGYLQDRHPASNMDLYVVTALLAKLQFYGLAKALVAQKLSLFKVYLFNIA
ncbi:hypothetical protein SO802_034026 [Lithocarpus litseifolius]|uniref:Uncharacterized protein n=1 Tax=Lithocarpus litseifolius TaxID=425828 RepID=A0AAW2BEX4_9ROSI